MSLKPIFKIFFYLALALVLRAFFIPQAVLAKEYTRVRINEETLLRGYTVSHETGQFRFAITPKQITQEVTVTLKNDTVRDTPLPSGKKAVSPFYTFEVRGVNSNPIIVKRPSWVAIRFYSQDNYSEKAIYYWDSNKNQWVKMPSKISRENQEVHSITHLPFSRVVVLEDDNSYRGLASWFPSSRGLVAASNDFPIGKHVKVVNLENQKSVKVKIVSNGPYVPGRIIDLADEAFVKLAPLSQGVINVQVQETEIDIVSPVGILIDAKTGEILWEKNSNEVKSIASLTKMMTALVFLNTGTSFDKVVTMEASDMVSGSRLRVSVGETLKVKDLFYATLLGSANNASLALARSTGLSREEFVHRMNEKAQLLGLTKTHFVEPSGLDPENKSTAREVALFSREALKFFVVLQATTSREYTFTTINRGIFHRLKNTNELLDTNLRLTGGKTGYLDEAGYCLMTKAKNDKGNEVIAVVLGSADSQMRFRDTQRLLEWGLAEFY